MIDDNELNLFDADDRPLQEAAQQIVTDAAVDGVIDSLTVGEQICGPALDGPPVPTWDEDFGADDSLLELPPLQLAQAQGADRLLAGLEGLPEAVPMDSQDVPDFALPERFAAVADASSDYLGHEMPNWSKAAIAEPVAPTPVLPDDLPDFDLVQPQPVIDADPDRFGSWLNALASGSGAMPVSEIPLTGTVAHPAATDGDPNQQGTALLANTENETDLLAGLVADIDWQMAGATDLDESVKLNQNVHVLAQVTEEQHVIFMLDGTAYSMPIENVTEIGLPLTVTPLPHVPAWVLGVANLRGDIISVVDLRAFFGKGLRDSLMDARMLVVRSCREDVLTALVVDYVSEIRYVTVANISAPSAPVEDNVGPYMRGVYEHNDRLLVVLDAEKLMLSQELRQFELSIA